jgi:MSHA pilin protein MshD
MRCANPRRYRGVSLLEFVLGIALMGIVLAGCSLFFWGQRQAQLDPVLQLRATTLAHALSQQILAVKFDEQNDPYNQLLCSAADCTAADEFGPEAGESVLADFDDVDDFHGWCASPVAAKDTGLALLRPELYEGYQLQVCVSTGQADKEKQILLDVLLPTGSKIGFMIHRYNIR